MNELAIQYEQNTPEWDEWRKTGLGATDAAAVFGKSKWATPLSVYAMKKGLEKPLEQAAPMEWGHRIEPVIIDKIMEAHTDFKDCRRGLLYGDDYRHCSLDAEAIWCHDGIEEPVVIEAKTARTSDGWDPVPPGYYAQVQWQMGITGYQHAFFTVLVGSCDWFEVQVDFDPHYFEEMVAVCDKFWNQNILADVPPNPTHILADVDSAAMSAISAGVETETADDVELTEEEIEKLRYLKSKAEDAEQAYASYKSDLQFKMMNGGNLVANGKKVAYYVNKPGAVTVDKNKLKKEYPDIYEKVLKTGLGTRYVTFRV